MWQVALVWLAGEPSPVPAWNTFAGYGVVGAIAFGGLVFAWRIFKVIDEERVALAKSNTELHVRMLALVTEHKTELLRVYETVMPTMASTVEALKDASRLLEEHQRDQIARQRRG